MSLPTVSIADATGNAPIIGTAPMPFAVTLSIPAPTGGVRVNYATIAGEPPNGASAGGNDYIGVPAGSITIPAGQTTGTIIITLKANPSLTTARHFTVRLTSAVGATLCKMDGVGLIEPPLPTVSIAPTTVAAGEMVAKFAIRLSEPATQPVVCKYATVAGTASAGGGDYIGTSGTEMTIPSGSSAAAIHIVISKTPTDLPRTFSLTLTIESGAVADVLTAKATLEPTIVPPPSPPPVVGKTHLNIVTDMVIQPGAYGRITINTPSLASVVTAAHCDIDNIDCQRVGTLNVSDCKITGPGLAAIAVWRFVNLSVQNCLTQGTGAIFFTDLLNTAKSVSILRNRGINIGLGSTIDPAKYTSFIQAQNVHVPGMEIGWNWLTNTRGQSSTADGISFMASGGTPESWANRHDNMVDGIFRLPLGPGDNGSGCMALDPGLKQNYTGGGYTLVQNDTVLASENQCFVMASGHDITFDGCTSVNDGTSTPYGSWGIQIFNWGSPLPATPANLFGKSTTVKNHRSYVKPGKYRLDYSLPAIVVKSGNSDATWTSTEAAERIRYAQKVAAMGIVIGPRI